MNILHRGLLLGASLAVLSCQDRNPTEAPSNQGSVAFRFQTSHAVTLPRADVVAVQVWLDDTIPLIDNRYDWNDGAADLVVPLHRALRFEVRGLRRKFNRDMLLWTATGRDTLEGTSAKQNVVAMQTTIADTTAPDVRKALVEPGNRLVVLDSTAGILGFMLAPGANSGSLVLPADLAEALLLDGSLVVPSAQGWSLDFELGQSATIELVGQGESAVRWVLNVISGDLVPVAFTIDMSPSLRRDQREDTIVFTLPYVVDSAPMLRIALVDSRDVPSAIALGSDSLDRASTDWTVPLAVPPAGEGGGIVRVLTARDSNGNTSRIPLRIVRSAAAREPELSWSTPPRNEPQGARTTKFVLRVVGGDSLSPPVFACSTLARPSAAREAAPRSGDTAWWESNISLQDQDSGFVVAKVSNLVGVSWSLPPSWIGRFDSLGADITAPKLSVLSPSGVGYARSGTISMVSGKAWDERSGKVRILVSHSGVTDSVDALAADSSWSWVLTWSGDGDTTISITARDVSGNTSSRVQVRWVRDSRRPAFTLTTVPAILRDTVRTSTRSLGFSVISSAPDLRRVWAVRLGATDTLDVPQESPGSWEAAANLVQGWNTWVVGTSDSAGNDSLRILRILYDSIAPTLTRVLPAKSPDTVEAGSSVGVSWNVVESFGPVVVKVDGAPATLVAGTVATSVKAPTAGRSRRVVVVATDAVGNTRTDSSLVLVATIAEPVQIAGVASGTTGREFFARFSCTDSGAILQASTGAAWSASAESLFVGADTSVTYRCQIGSSSSKSRPFAWTSKDTVETLPAGLAGIPDSAWALGATEDGSLWIVSSHDSAWVRLIGETSWRNIPSPFTSRGAVDLVEGDPSTGARWFQAWKGTSLVLASAGGTSVSLQASLVLQRTVSGRPVGALGRNTFGLAYLSDEKAVLELRRFSNLASPLVFPSVGAPVTTIKGIVENYTDGYIAIGAALSAPYTFSASISQVPATTILQASATRTSYMPSFLRKLKSGQVLLGTQGAIPIPKGVQYVGRLYRFASGSSIYEPTDSATFQATLVAGTSTISEDRIWLGFSNTVTAPVASLSATNLSAATDVPSLSSTTFSRKIATTRSGAAWVAMQTETDLRPRLFRFHRR